MDCNLRRTDKRSLNHLETNWRNMNVVNSTTCKVTAKVSLVKAEAGMNMSNSTKRLLVRSFKDWVSIGLK